MSKALQPISSVEAARAFLVFKDREVTALKMQKLVYFAHENHIVSTAKPFIADPVEAWVEGPVFPALERFIGNGDELVAEADLTETRNRVMDARTVTYIEGVWERLKEWSGRDLSDKAHAEGAPWHLATHPQRTFFQRLIDWEPKNPVISDALIRQYCRESGKWRYRGA